MFPFAPLLREINRLNEDENLSCPMCFNLVPKQITLECGHIICPTCLRNKASPSSCCTVCWKFSQLKTLQADIVMYPEGEAFCEIHREDQKLFCEVNQSLLCGTCSKSDHHRNHKHWPIAVAALKFRNKILTFLETFHNSLAKRQRFLMQEKGKSVTWAVVWTDPRTTTYEMFHKDICAVQNYIWSKGETEPLQQEELILGNMKKKFWEFYQHLKELEATEEYQIMKQKEAWEAMMDRENRFLMDGIKELAEKIQKPNVEVIQEFTQVSDVVFSRLYKYQFFHSFSPKFHHLYYIVVNKFLYYFQTLGLSQGYNRFNLSKDKKAFIIVAPASSGKTYTIYVTGSVELDTMMLNIHVNPFIHLYG